MDATMAAALLGEDVTELRRFESAGISEVHAVTTSDGSTVIVKEAPDEWHWTIEKEAFVYGLLRAHAAPVPIPRVLATPRPGVLVLEQLPGTSPTDVETHDLYRQLGALLARFHDVRLDSFGYVGTSGVVEPHATNADYMRFQFEKKLREHAEHGGDAGLRERIAAHVAEREQLFAGCETARLCHNDGHEGNVVVERGRISGVFDVQNAVAADPLLDLAKTAYYSRRDEQETVVTALAEGHGDLRDDWRDALDLYVLYHQLELWGWFATLGTTEHLDGIEAELRYATRSTD